MKGMAARQEIFCAARRLMRNSGSCDAAMETLGVCLGALEASAWPDVAWRFSALNTDGSPVEFAFSSRDNNLRYTTEVAGPELDSHARLDAACDLIARLGHVPPAAEQTGFWKSLQAQRSLRWGLWLGIRHDGSAETLKLYIEVPAAQRANKRLPPPLLAESQLLMIGHELQQGQNEYYFRQTQIDDAQIDVLLCRAADGDARHLLLHAVQELCQMPYRAAFRMVNFGYSMTDPNSNEGRLTLFVRARTLGRMSHVRRQMLKHEQLSAKQSSTYRDLVGEVADGELPDHGMISIVAEQGQIEMRVSLSGMTLAQLCGKQLNASGTYGG
jgi:hypothetical protein